MKRTSTFAFCTLISLSLATIALADTRDDFDGGKRAAFGEIAAANAARLSAARLGQSATDGSAAPTGSGIEHCIDGMAAGLYACHRIDMLAHIDITELGVTFVNDIWGWSDRKKRREYALLGATEGTVVIDVTKPWRPEIVGTLPAASLEPTNPFWRDIKVYKDHAYIISEQIDHGMQVLDLDDVRRADRSGGPVTFEAAANYNEFSSSHNIVINEDSGYAYVVGANTCLGGLEMIDIRDPANPTNAGCFSDHGYIHDAQCVTYKGPDKRYRGREICFSASTNTGAGEAPFFMTLSIVDVTDKGNLQVIANKEYGDGFGYSHQGWLTPDQRYYLHDDELDEFFGTVTTTTTRLWDLSDLEAPDLFAETTNGQTSIDHNLYTRGRYSYASNYTTGLRIFDIRKVGKGNYDEVAFFDLYPENDDPTFEGGTWSNYPYYKRRNVIAVSSIDRGLFLLRARLRR